MAPLLAAVVAVLALTLVATASLGMAYSARAQAQTAADAAALAAAVASYPATGRQRPVEAARAVAARNGAELASCTCVIDASLEARTVAVVVSLRIHVPVFGSLDVRSSSRAEFDPRLWLGR